MKLDIYYIDAFAESVFSGNPAAVIFSDLNDETIMQKIAAENKMTDKKVDFIPTANPAIILVAAQVELFLTISITGFLPRLV